MTARDLINFWQGLLSHKIISEDMLSKMLSKQSGDGNDPEEGFYGLGVWIIDNPNGKDYAYLQGCDPGVSAIAEYNPDKNMISVMLSNYGDNVWALMRRVRKEYY